MIIMSLWRPWHQGPSPSGSTPEASCSSADVKSAANMESFKSFYKVRDCSVRLERLSPEEIERHCHRKPVAPLPPSLPPQAAVVSPGKQLHLIQKRGRGRPRKNVDGKGQCKVSSLSGSLMKLKIVKVAEAISKFSVPQEGQVERIKKIDLAAAAIVSDVVGSGYFNSALYPAKPSKRARMMTPRHDWRADSSLYSYSCPFSYRSPFLGGGSNFPGAARGMPIMTPRRKESKKKKSSAQEKVNVSVVPAPSKEQASRVPGNDKERASSRGKISVPMISKDVSSGTNTNSSSSSLFTPVVVKKNKTPDKAKKSEVAKDCGQLSANTDVILEPPREDGNSWVSALFETKLASEVVKEAALGDFMPDISIIQGYTDDLVDLLENTGTSSVLNPLSSTGRNLAKTSFTLSDSRNSFQMNTPESLHEEPVHLEEVKPQNSSSSAVHKFQLYEELYRNDILLINAEDEELPLPV